MSSTSARPQNKNVAAENARSRLPGWDDFEHWRTNDQKIHAEICRLIGECMRTPFDGLGKPEPLKGDLSGYWSRRITKEHRLVYYYGAGTLTVIACRYHY
ncbi:MAG: Txe/YoeB family addiction module toxin [Pseudomonas farsensis]